VEAGDAGKGTVKILSVSAAGKLAEAGSVVGQGPVWRPDGRAVTFVRGADVWQADAKGEHAVQIATLPSAKGEQVALSRLSYAPTGDALVVAVVRTNASGPHQELWVLRGKQLREIHSDPVATEFGLAPERYGALPAWAGERILFSSDRDGAPRVWSIRADGSGLRAITPANSVWAALAPGGASLVFVRPDADAPLWKVSPDGSGLASIQWKKTR
jgi:Tol biopolymer transport system component